MAPTSVGAIVAPSITQKDELMIQIPIITEDEQLIPTAAHQLDAGVDLRAAEGNTLSPGERVIVPTGIKIDIPEGYAGFIHPRSGLAAKYGITVVNAPGTIDAGYQGEIKVILLNTSETENFVFNKYDRIAQLVFQRIEYPMFVSEDFLSTSVRNANGFGSTGVN